MSEFDAYIKQIQKKTLSDKIDYTIKYLSALRDVALSSNVFTVDIRTALCLAIPALESLTKEMKKTEKAR